MEMAAETEAPMSPVNPILSKPPLIYEETEESDCPPRFPTKIQDLADNGETETRQEAHDRGSLFSGGTDTVWAGPATTGYPGEGQGTFMGLLALADGRSLCFPEFGTETRQEAHDRGSLFSGGADTVWAGPATTGYPGEGQGTFMGLLVLADAAAVPHGSFLCFPDSYYGRALTRGPVATTRHQTHMESQIFQDRHTYEGMEDGVVSEASIPYFAPITPNKSLGVDYQPTTKEGDELRRLMLKEAKHGNEFVVHLFATESPPSISKNTKKINIQKDDEEHSDDIDAHAPQQRPRRKKHRPKVVREGKPKQAKKPKTPKSVVEGEKRVRRKRAEGSLEEIIGDSIDPKLDNPSNKSCKRVLNFDIEEQSASSSNEPAVELNSTDNLSEDLKDTTETARLKEKTNLSNLSVMIGGDQATELDNHYVHVGDIQKQATSMSGIRYNSLQAYASPLPWMQNIHKRKRSDKVQISSSSILTSSTSTEASTRSKSDPRLGFLFASSITQVQDKRQDMGGLLVFSQDERSTKKRSQSHTRATKFAQGHMISNYQPHKQRANSMNPQTCIETLLAEMPTSSRKKRTKRPKDIFLIHHKQHQALLQSRGGTPRRLWRKPVEATTIKENSRNERREMNAIVPYRYSSHVVAAGSNKMMISFQKDGTIVRSEHVKKRKPRPRVDLDGETTRVWKLLLKDINSEGIDGTAEEKTKWWEKERSLFRGRAESFIALMHLVQGDRRFSPWKGSVVDSVVGVFLTQNVSDHLSSSAFMSLVSRYPPKSKQKQSSDGSLISDPDVSILDLVEYTRKWREKMPSPTGSISVNETESNEEVEVIERVSSSTSDVDALSFQDSVISSQNSMKAANAERRGSNSEIEEDPSGFSKTNPFTSSTSFMQLLLHMAGSNIPSEFHVHENGDVSNPKIDPESSKHCEETVSNTANSVLEEEGERIMNQQHPLAREADIVKTENYSRPGKDNKVKVDWDSLRKEAETRCGKKGRTPNTTDSVDWERIRSAEVQEIADAIRDRGMNNLLAGRIQDFLNRLINEHGSLDLEWLRDVPPDKAKEFLLSIRGLGLKSVECVRLLTLHHLAFPVDTNVGRIAVRLGWVPLQPLPESLQLHLLELYPVLDSIQKFLWPRLCKLDQRTLYALHYQMITFGKVFCTKSKPNCNACPMRGECRHFASAFASARLALPEPGVRSSGSTTPSHNNPEPLLHPLPLQEVSAIPCPNNPEIVQLSLPSTEQNGTNRHDSTELWRLRQCLEEAIPKPSNCQPIIEEPVSPQHECTQMVDDDETDIEDLGEIPTIRLNMEEFTQNLQNYMQKNMELQEGDMSKALVALTPEAASIPVAKLKNVSRLRTEHLVYELPEDHPLLNGLDKREPDDPGRYLLAIWTPGENAISVQPSEKKCNSQEHGTLCNDSLCLSCDSIREANSPTVRGTLLIPCRTAMRGSFPLNGTYFQVNEVFADHESSLHPIDVPRDWLWKLQRRTVYFGTSIPTTFRGLTTEGIQHCFWRGV